MVIKIAITGGPGSGKTTVKEDVKNHFESIGYKVIMADEIATRFINMGIRSFGTDAIPQLAFQELLMKDQLYTEELINNIVKYYDNKKVIIIYDRGALDNRAYTNNDEEFNEVLSKLSNKTSISDLMNRYDAVIDLISRKDFYTTENNKARSESLNEAILLGKKTIHAWLGHKNIKIVMPKDTIEEKITEVISIINNLLDEKQIKKQEKYIIDTTNLEIDINTPYKDIEQTYLISKECVEKRIRKIVFNGITTYTFTVYRINENQEKELVTDDTINEKTYKKLLEFADETRKTINKKRYYFTNSNTYYYIDIFNDKTEEGILEVNVLENEIPSLPDNIKIIEKVTGNTNYNNKELSLKNKSRILKR